MELTLKLWIYVCVLQEFFLKFVIVVFALKLTFTFIRPFFFGIYLINIFVLLFVV